MKLLQLITMIKANSATLSEYDNIYLNGAEGAIRAITDKGGNLRKDLERMITQVARHHARIHPGCDCATCRYTGNPVKKV